MKILITAGNTQTPIDEVRCITNIFTGKTGAQIALEASRRGNQVTLLTSHPEVLQEEFKSLSTISTIPYRTYDDLHDLMAREMTQGKYDILIHAAAVSDYQLTGIYAPDHDSQFDPQNGTWQSGSRLKSVQSGKVKSHHPELWLRLVPTAKLADRVRDSWGFKGIFVKFKLEVGIDDRQLHQIAAQSRAQSNADYIVANTLEGKNDVAFLGDREGHFQRIPRQQLATTLLDRLEQKVSPRST